MQADIFCTCKLSNKLKILHLYGANMLWNGKKINWYPGLKFLYKYNDLKIQKTQGL